MKNLKTQGFLLIDVDVVALNNAGKSQDSNFDNAVATKSILKNGREYTYVSGQAWRYWWRDTLQKNHEWKLSPITREKKIAFTESDPIKYPDDDIFGYMKAAIDVKRDDKGNPILNSRGKEETENVTVTRVSPLKNSAIVSVGSTNIAKNWASMARQDGDSVPYVKDEYSAIMKGMFSLDLAQVGTFATYNKTGFKNLTLKLREEALKDGATPIPDSFVKDQKGNPQELIQLPREKRLKRIEDTIKALKTISGGAMQTNNMGDVTPKFIILATMETGNHPFSHIVKNDGARSELVSLNIEGLKEVLKDYEEYFEGNIYIGKRSGFLDEYNDKLTDLSNEFANVKLHSINEAIDKYCKELVTKICNGSL